MLRKRDFRLITLVVGGGGGGGGMMRGKARTVLGSLRYIPLTKT